MAKQVVGPLERHAEKIVVGVAGLILIGVIAKYLISSPNRVDLGSGQTVFPKDIDAALAAKAAQVRDRLRRAQPKVEVPEPLAGTFNELLDPFEKANIKGELPMVVAIQPDVPIIDPPDVIMGGTKLVEVIQLEPPKITSGRTTFVTQDQDEKEVYFTRNWATVSSVFDRKKEEQLQVRTYGAVRREVYFGPVELQRRSQRTDGSWSDEDWKTLSPNPRENLSPPPPISLKKEGKQFVVPRNDHVRFLDWVDELWDPKKQLNLIRPLMPEKDRGTPWTFPILTSYNDVLLQDDEYLYPTSERDALELDDRYGLGGGEEQPEEAEKPTKKPFSQQLKEAEALLVKATSVDETTYIYNIAFTINQSSDASGSEKIRARRIMEGAEQKEKDIRRKMRRKAGRRPGGPVQQKTEKKRQIQPRQQIWAHDAGENSIVAGKVYQYRIRDTIYNRLAAEPAKFDNPHDAQVVFVKGPWSEPSDPVVVPATQHYFVTGADERKNQVNIELYQWFEGVWVKTRARFGVGEKLARTARANTPSFDDPSVVDRALVPFEAGATIVDIDFQRSYREKKKGSRRGGFSFPTKGTACSVVVVDASGILHERFLPADKADPGKTELNNMVWTPPKKGGR